MNNPNSKQKTELSVRPKVRTKFPNDLKIDYKPLEQKSVTFVDKSGDKKSISLISKEFNLILNSVYYYEPSFEEFRKLNQIIYNNWLVNCKKYETFVRELFYLPYFRFWSVVAFNENVRSALESYLTNSTRPYRLHPMLKNNDIKYTLSNIHELVFKVYCRILLSKETEINFMTESYHSELIISKKILDIFNIIDLVQIYGYGSNAEIIRHFFTNFVQKNYCLVKNELKIFYNDISNSLNIFSNDFDFNNEFIDELYNLVCNVTDLMCTLNKIVLMEPRLAFICTESNLIENLIPFYSKYYCFIESSSSHILNNGKNFENFYNFLKNQITLSQASALLFFHHVLKNVFVSSIVAKDSTLDKYKIFDTLMNLLNLVSTEKRFCYDYFSKFEFESEFRTLLNDEELEEKFSIRDVLNYYSMTFKTSISEYKNKHNILNSSNNNTDKLPDFGLPSVLNNQLQDKPTLDNSYDPDIVMKEQLIQEMFPDLADGFIFKCLEHFDFNNERVVDAILECNLPPELDSLNRQLTKEDLFKAKTAAYEKNKNIDFDVKEKQKEQNNQKMEHISDNKLNPSEIYIGKKDKIGNIISQKDDVKDKTIQLLEKIQFEENEAIENAKKLIERGKLTKEQLKSNIEFIGIDLYEDEFDDTYENEENLDVAFILEDEPINQNDDDDNENFEKEKSLNNESINSHQSIQKSSKFSNVAKFDNYSKYSKKQFYNKRNFTRNQHNPNNDEPNKKNINQRNSNNQSNRKESNNAPNIGVNMNNGKNGNSRNINKRSFNKNNHSNEI